MFFLLFKIYIVGYVTFIVPVVTGGVLWDVAFPPVYKLLTYLGDNGWTGVGSTLVIGHMIFFVFAILFTISYFSTDKKECLKDALASDKPLRYFFTH